MSNIQVKPSAILRRAARLVRAYVDDDTSVGCVGYTMSDWKYGCHAISCAAFEAGELRRAILYSANELEMMIPHIFTYFNNHKPSDLPKPRASWFKNPEDRIEALLKATKDAEDVGE